MARRGYQYKENEENIKIMQQMKRMNPKYLEHCFLKNGLIKAFAMSQYGGYELLEAPVCGHCEKPGAWHTDDSCYCWSCGTVTPKAVTLYEYLASELGLTEEDLQLMLHTANGTEIIIDGGEGNAVG